MKRYSLDNAFSKEELLVLDKLKYDSHVQILKAFDYECYLFLHKTDDNYIGRKYDKNKLFDFKECFGDYEDYYNDAIYEYYRCVPKHIIKFYQFYLIETFDFPGEWYRGDKTYNGNIMLTYYNDGLKELLDNI